MSGGLLPPYTLSRQGRRRRQRDPEEIRADLKELEGDDSRDGTRARWDLEDELAAAEGAAAEQRKRDAECDGLNPRELAAKLPRT